MRGVTLFGLCVMFFIIGVVVVLGAVFGGFLAEGGKLGVLVQPFELVIICGAALGGFVIATPKHMLGKTFKGVLSILKGPKYKKAAYLELLCMLNAVFKLAKAKGTMVLESHIEKPAESSLFKQFPLFLADHHVTEFFCDFLRMLVMGADNPHEVEALMDQRIETHHHEESTISGGIQNVADAMPALGIVAAVLGIIQTMGSITEPPEVLGHHIGGALVGTFLGILISYGLLAPMASSLKAISESDVKYYLCLKAGILAYMQGYAPIMAVESARMVLQANDQPSFGELEAAIEAMPAAA